MHLSFTLHLPHHHLNGKHTIFGQMISGAEVLDRIENALVSGTERPKTNSIISTSVDERPVPPKNVKKTKLSDSVINSKKSESFIASEKISMQN